jgi:uncharacterized protein (TIGR02466 family)
MTTKKDVFAKKTYFPTLVFQMDIGEADSLNAGLLKSIYAERERDKAGIARSNFTELGGWHSHNDLHKSAEYAGLVAKIGEATQKMSVELGYHKDYEMQIGTMWSIINPPGSANRAHVHPGCLWSGVYYIQAPEGAGDIEFIEPRTALLMNQPRYIPKQRRPKDCWTKVRFAPTPGRMLFFPSWLYHAVDPNMTKETGDAANRIIISFNLNQRKA